MNCRICNDIGLARQLCSKHYQRYARQGDPHTDKRTIRVPRKCRIDGCGKLGPNKSKLCAMHERRRKVHGDPNYESGRRKNGQGTLHQGYMVVTAKGHPNVKTKSNGQILEHRLVMSKMLGRALRTEENVHHINGDKLDNRPANLELWVRSQPSGQRVQDLVNWAREIISRYG